MAEGFSTAAANGILDKLLVDYPWTQLHTGAPGSAGTANVATNTTRKTNSWAAAASGSKASNADQTWTNVPGSEDYTHFTQWSASAAGNFGGSGVITANAVTTGDTFTVSSGGFVLTVPTAS